VAEPARPLIKKPDKSLPTLASELWELVVGYLKQETLDPLKGLGKFVGLGIAGAAVLSIGLVFLAIALLRLLQFETDGHLSGNLSWIPYVITLVAVVLVAGFSAMRITAASKKRAR
jgi:hypothetical protein